MNLPLLQVDAREEWQIILRKNFNRVDAFVDFLELNEQQRLQVDFKPTFAFQVPLRLAKKMTKGDINDPLVKQFLPLKIENTLDPRFQKDPVCDKDFRETGKLLHKYNGRVLFVCTSACAMHCRYCFRQNFAYEKNKSFENELKWIEEDTTIHEVILSGGDPLSLSDEILGNLLESLSRMSHIKRIRFHTRFPIGIPERINQSFLNTIKQLPQQVYFVIHCNHPKELDNDLLSRLKELKKLGCVILNQAVLLKGINDDASTLIHLCEELANNGILPYYLHQLDAVQGAGHFEVEEIKGRELIEEISKMLPGFAVPKYVREIAGAPNKTPV